MNYNVINLKTLCYVKKARHLKTICYIMIFIGNIQERQTYRDRRQVSDCLGRAGVDDDVQTNIRKLLGVMEIF